MTRNGFARTLAAALLGLSAWAASSTAPHADPASPEAVRERERAATAAALKNLTPEMLQMVLKKVGVTPTADFSACLCPAGFHPESGGDGPCVHIGPLGGLTWGGYDMNGLAACAASAPLADGSNLLDRVADAARPANARKSPLPGSDSPGARLRQKVIELEEACLPVGSQIYRMLDEYDRQYDQYAKDAEIVKAIGISTQGRPPPGLKTPVPPVNERLVDEITKAIAAAPDACEQASEVNLISERASLANTEDMVTAIVATWVVPGGDDLVDIAKKFPALGLAFVISDFADSAAIWRKQQVTEVYTRAMEEARKVIRTNRPITAENYSSIIESYDDEAVILKEREAKARAVLEVRLEQIAKYEREHRPVAGAPAQDQINFVNGLNMEERQAFAIYDEALRDISLRMGQIANTKAMLEKHLKPRVDNTCEQFIAQNCHK